MYYYLSSYVPTNNISRLFSLRCLVLLPSINIFYNVNIRSIPHIRDSQVYYFYLSKIIPSEMESRHIPQDLNKTITHRAPLICAALNKKLDL
jgi:hypothetical protein